MGVGIEGISHRESIFGTERICFEEHERDLEFHLAHRAAQGDLHQPRGIRGSHVVPDRQCLFQRDIG